MKEWICKDCGKAHSPTHAAYDSIDYCNNCGDLIEHEEIGEDEERDILSMLGYRGE